MELVASVGLSAYLGFPECNNKQRVAITSLPVISGRLQVIVWMQKYEMWNIFIDMVSSHLLYNDSDNITLSVTISVTISVTQWLCIETLETYILHHDFSTRIFMATLHELRSYITIYFGNISGESLLEWKLVWHSLYKEIQC